MARVEKRLDLYTNPEKEDERINVSEREQLLILLKKLAEPKLPEEDRLEMVAQTRELLTM